MVPGGVTSTPFRFRGQYADEETGLSYNFHRYYDPATGRYLSADPIGLLGGPDVFAYANNCPTSAVDVEGLMYSIIRKNGVFVTDGESGGKLPFGTQMNRDDAWDTKYPQGCAEKAALRSLGTPADAKSKFTGEGYTIETHNGSRKDYNDALAEGRHNDILKSRMNPCPKCSAMLSGNGGLDIAGSVYATNEHQGKTTGGAENKWDKRSTSSDGPRTKNTSKRGH